MRRSASLATPQPVRPAGGPVGRRRCDLGSWSVRSVDDGRALYIFAYRISQCGGFRWLSRRRRAEFMSRHRRAHALALIWSPDAAAAFNAARLGLHACAVPRSRAPWRAARRLGRRAHVSSGSLPRRVVGRHSRLRRALCGAPESVPSPGPPWCTASSIRHVALHARHRLLTAVKHRSCFRLS